MASKSYTLLSRTGKRRTVFIAVGMAGGRKVHFPELLHEDKFYCLDQNQHLDWSFAYLKHIADEDMRRDNRHIYIDAVRQTKCARRSLADMARRKNFQVVFLVFTTRWDIEETIERSYKVGCPVDYLPPIELIDYEEQSEYPKPHVSFIFIYEEDMKEKATNLNQRA